MIKSPIANWQPQSEIGLANAKLLKAHANKKRAATSKAGLQAKRAAKSSTGSPLSKRQAVDRKRQLDADRSTGETVALFRRERLPSDEVWQLDTYSGEPIPSSIVPDALTEQQCSTVPRLPKPSALMSRGGTLYSALRDVRQLLDNSANSIWIPSESNWLCMWLPTCGTIDQVRSLLSFNPALERFYRLIVPAIWITARRHGGSSDGKLYRGWREALERGEPATHWGCYVLIYIDSPAQRKVLYDSTLARLRLAGQGVIELKRGVVFQPVAGLVLHETITDQPLQGIPRGKKFGGPSKTHLTFRLEENIVLDSPSAHSNGLRCAELTANEQRQYQHLLQRKAAPITLDGECCQ